MISTGLFRNSESQEQTHTKLMMGREPGEVLDLPVLGSAAGIKRNTLTFNLQLGKGRTFKAETHFTRTRRQTYYSGQPRGDTNLTGKKKGIDGHWR